MKNDKTENAKFLIDPAKFSEISEHLKGIDNLNKARKQIVTSIRIDKSFEKEYQHLVKSHPISAMVDTLLYSMRDKKLLNEIVNNSEIMSIRQTKISGARKSIKLSRFAIDELKAKSQQLNISRDQLLNYLFKFASKHFSDLLLIQDKKLEVIGEKLEKIYKSLNSLIEEAKMQISDLGPIMFSLHKAGRQVEESLDEIMYLSETGQFADPLDNE